MSVLVNDFATSANSALGAISSSSSLLRLLAGNAGDVGDVAGGHGPGLDSFRRARSRRFMLLNHGGKQ